MLVLPLLDRQIALLVEGLGSRLVDSILVFGNLAIGLLNWPMGGRVGRPMRSWDERAVVVHTVMVTADIVGSRSIVVMEVEPQ